MCKAMALFYVFTGSESTSFMFKVIDPAACWCTVQFATIVDTLFQTSTRLKEQGLSVGYTKTNLPKPMMFDLVRMRLFSQTTRDVERIPNEGYIWSTSQKECLRSEYLSTSNLDYAALRQGCVPPVCEVHVHNYLLSVQTRKDDVEVYTSVQVHMQEVAGVEQFPIGLLTCIWDPWLFSYWMHCSRICFKQLRKYLRLSTGWPKISQYHASSWSRIKNCWWGYRLCHKFLNIKRAQEYYKLVLNILYVS